MLDLRTKRRDLREFDGLGLEGRTVTASADAAIFDALNALSAADVAAAFGVADAVDAVGALRG